MKPVTQTILHNPPETIGNCFVACLSSVLEIPIDSIPHFAERACIKRDPLQVDQKLWDQAIQNFLKPLGWMYFTIWADDYTRKNVRGYHLIEGNSKRGPHVVVGKDGVMVWDPHPSREGLVAVENFGLFVSLDPARPHPLL